MELETETNRLMYIVSNLLNRMKMMHCSSSYVRVNAVCFLPTL